MPNLWKRYFLLLAADWTEKVPIKPFFFFSLETAIPCLGCITPVTLTGCGGACEIIGRHGGASCAALKKILINGASRRFFHAYDAFAGDGGRAAVLLPLGLVVELLDELNPIFFSHPDVIRPRCSQE